MRLLCLLLLTLSIPVCQLCAYDLVGYLDGESLGDQFGSAVTEADFNGDGIKDLIIGSPSADDAGTSSGKVDVFFGGPGADLIADVTLVGSAGSFFGSSLSSAGDFNGDGFDDLLIGAPFYDLPDENAGAAFLFYGGLDADTAVDHIFTGEAAGDYFGISVTSAGDFNDDSDDDIAIGAYHADLTGYDNIGKTYVYYGGLIPDFDVDKILIGDAAGERSGFSLTALDFNGDAVSDIAVGAYSYDGMYINQGRVYIYFGGDNPDATYDLTVTGDSSGYKFGWSLSSGRIDDDQFDDLVMGADGFPISDKSAGKIYVYYGGPGYNAYPDYTYTLGRAEDDFLGYSIFAGVDLNSDGSDELIAGMPGNDDGATDGGGAVLISGGAIPAVDASFLGNSSSEEMGQAVCIWSDYGSSFLIVCGTPEWNSFTGRVHLYGSAGSYVCGDANANGNVDIDDVVYLITYIFGGGPAPDPLASGDADCSGGIDIDDVVYLINYIFGGGYAPCDIDGDGETDC